MSLKPEETTDASVLEAALEAATHNAGRLNDQNHETTAVLRFMMVYTFFFASIRDGLAPLLSVFLVVVKGWTPGAAGLIWFVKDAAAILSSPFCGAAVDRSKHKRALLFTTTAIATLTGITVVWTQNFALLIVKSAIEGGTVGFVQPAKSSLILGLIGQEHFDHASKKVEMVDHLGSLVGIVITGCIGLYLYPNVANVFYVIGAGGVLACLSLLFMPLSSKSQKDEEELRGNHNSLIDHEASRNLTPGGTPDTYMSILKNRDIVLFGSSVFFFHLGNAAILPLLSQLMSIDSGRAGIPLTCANVAIAQFTSIFSVWAMGSLIEKGVKHKYPVLVGYITAVPLRCAIIVTLNEYWPNQYALMATQLLDGVGAGTFGLSLPLVLKELTYGTGQFSFSIGLVVTLGMCGGALSNLVSGYIVMFMGYSIGFISLACLGSVSIVLISFVNVQTVHMKDKSQDQPRTGEVTNDVENTVLPNCG